MTSYQRKAAGGVPGRRQFLRQAALFGAGGAGFWLAGCGSSTNNKKPTANTAPAAARSPASPTPPPKVDGYAWIQNKPDLTAAPKKGGVLKFGTTLDAPSLDPVKSASFVSASLYTPVYNRLFRAKYGSELEPYNPWKFELQPDLALSFEHPDPLAYVLKLRPGVKFQDVAPVNGRTFTAEDAKFSLDAYRTSADLTAALPFAGIEAIDATTLKLTLAAPANYVVPALAENRFVMLAKEVAAADGDFSKRAIGTGPFILDEFVQSNHARYRRNPNYYRSGYPLIDGIEYTHTNDPVASQAGFISGNYHLVRLGAGTKDEVDAILSQDKSAVVLKLQSDWQANVFHLGFRLDRPPYNDVRLRKALCKAFDRNTYGKQNLNGDFNILGAYAWTQWFDTRPDLGDAYVYDPAAAKALLQAAGLANATIPVEYYPYRQYIEDEFQIMQQEYKQLGVTLQLQKLDLTTFQAKYFGGKIQNGTVGFIPTFPRWAPLSMRLLFHSSSPQNYYGLNDPQLDAALDKLTSSDDVNEQKQAGRDAWLRLMTTPYFLQLVEGPSYYTHSPKVHRFLPNMYNAWGNWGQQVIESFWLNA